MATTVQVRLVPLGGLASMSFPFGQIDVPASTGNVDIGIFRQDVVGNPDGLQLTSKVLPGFSASSGVNFFFTDQGNTPTNSYQFDPGEESQVLRIIPFSDPFNPGDSIRLFWNSVANPALLDNAQGAPNDPDNGRYGFVDINFI